MGSVLCRKIIGMQDVWRKQLQGYSTCEEISQGFGIVEAGRGGVTGILKIGKILPGEEFTSQSTQVLWLSAVRPD